MPKVLAITGVLLATLIVGALTGVAFQLWHVGQRQVKRDFQWISPSQIVDFTRRG